MSLAENLELKQILSKQTIFISGENANLSKHSLEQLFILKIEQGIEHLYFINPQENTIELDKFINKAIFYLWIEVFQDEEETIFEDKSTYENFFPIQSNGKEMVLKMLKREDFSGVEISTISNTNKSELEE